MKSSIFNCFFPYPNDEGKMIAYNSFSNSLALMDIDKYRVFLKFRDDRGRLRKQTKKQKVA